MMADQYSGDMIAKLGRVVAETVEPYHFPQPVMNAPSLPVPPGMFTWDIFPYIDVAGWLPFVFFGELQRRTQGSNAKASRVWFE